MSDLSFHSIDAAWWPYLFILLAGWLPTDVWRVLGVLSAGRLDENSPMIGLIRAIATGLVAAVIARLVLYPTGSLEAVAGVIRVGALAAGFIAYLFAGRSVLIGIVAAEAILIGLPLLSA